MHLHHPNSANQVWRRLVCDVLGFGEAYSPRDQSTLELVGVSSLVDMQYPIVTSPIRKLSYDFMVAEARWILSGDNRVEPVARYAPSIRNYSDDGIRFFGAYGPRVVSQISHIIRTLSNDQASRQAVLTIWRENPPITRDVPCTIDVQWLIRDGKLHCIDNMRSSDLWLGWPYDIFNFTMLSTYIALELRRQAGIVVELGNLRLNAGSQHLYGRNLDQARKVRLFYFNDEYEPLCIDDWDRGADLIDYLYNHNGGGWLQGLFQKQEAA